MISTTNEYGEERSFKAKFISTRNRTILVSVKIISYADWSIGVNVTG